MLSFFQKTSYQSSPFGRGRIIYRRQPSSPRSGFWHKFVILLIFIILLIAGAILASILIFGKSPKGVGERLIEINFSGQTEVESLAPIAYTITIVNREFADLKAAELRINFPNGFVLTESDQPCSETLLNGCTWSLGKIRRGESKMINLVGYFFEPSQSINDLKSFQGILDFEFQDFSSHFQKELKFDIFVKPILSINLGIEREIPVGLIKQWQIDLKNLSQQTVNNLKIVLEVPNGFVIIPPEISDENVNFNIEGSEAIWRVKMLEPLAEKQLYFEGYFSQFFEAPLKFKILAGLVNNQGQIFIQDSLSEQIALRVADLNFSLSSTNKQTEFHWTEELPLHLVYQNTGNQIEDLNFKIEILNGQFIDWQNLTNSKWQWFSEQEEKEGSNWLIESSEKSRTIIWNPSQIFNLDKVSLGESGEIRFVLRLSTAPQNIESQEIIFKPKVSGKYPLTGEQFKIEGAPLVLKIY
ncbi:MAG: hypothetical protein ACP5IX_01340 [Patescibacteria group bacterium]